MTTSQILDKTKLFFIQGVDQSCQGDYARAIERFDQALKLNPHDADLYGHRCVARYQLGDRQGAIADCQQAASLYWKRGNVKDYEYALRTLRKLET